MDGSMRAVGADGSILLFGGPYGNLQATTALFAEAARLAIPTERIVCTGDLAAYCADPAATIDLVRASGIHVVMGNCDEQLGRRAPECGCGFPGGGTCDELSKFWYAHADAEVRDEQRSWLAALPRRLDILIGGCNFTVVHGGVAAINTYVFASSPALLKLRELEAAGPACDGIIAGHCGLPFTQDVAGRLWHNAGVIGLPAHDGTPRIWFSTLTPIAGGGIEIAHHALGYDHAGAAAAMARAGLPNAYRDALSTGIWPSCDVLPAREIRAAGVRLEAGVCTWLPDLAARAVKRGRRVEVDELWPSAARNVARPLDRHKFKHPFVTAKGEPRAGVALKRLETLWMNTGTLCNITCRNCYIESSPRNDSLVYLTQPDVEGYLDEIERDGLGTSEIGFTGGEPFMNPSIVKLLDACLSRGFKVLVLTNAMRPMMRHKLALLALRRQYGARLAIRVSLDHYTQARHEEERGSGTFVPTLDGLRWLADNGFNLAVAGRTMWGEAEPAERAGYRRLFETAGIAADSADPTRLVLFPEMDDGVDVPEITTACWGILGKSPDDIMCANSRMVVKRKGAEHATVVACTLLPHDPEFDLGHTLKDAARTVQLNHPHCAKFCVLGGATCAPAASTGHDATAGKSSSELV